jgi:DNA-binding IclR family transcriptional regulator
MSMTKDGPVVPGGRAAFARRQVSQVLGDLAAATGLRARFGVWHEFGVTYIERAAGPADTSCTTGLRVLPAHATALGKAILAHAPSGVLEDVIHRGLPAFTPFNRTTSWELRRDVASIRFSGMAVSRQEWREGEYVVAAPLFGPDGNVIGALDVVVDEMADRLRDIRAAIAIATRVLSRQPAADPSALPCGSGAAPLRWRADPTSTALVWNLEVG